MATLHFEKREELPLIADGNAGKGSIMFAMENGDKFEVEADRILLCAEHIRRGKFRQFHEDSPIWAADVL